MSDYWTGYIVGMGTGIFVTGFIAVVQLHRIRRWALDEHAYLTQRLKEARRQGQGAGSNDRDLHPDDPL